MASSSKTLAAAISEANAGDTLQLTASFKQPRNGGVTISKDLTLDLNGQTMTYEGINSLITVSGCTLTVTDSGANGAIQATEANYIFYLEELGKLVVNAGTLSSPNGSALIWNGSSGKITINGGTVSASGRSYGTIFSGSGSRGAIAVTGGTVQAIGDDGRAISSDSGAVTVSGGTVEATGNNGKAIDKKSATGTITVSGGIVRATTGPAIYQRSYGPIVIKGGTVTSANTGAKSGTIYFATAPRNPQTMLTITDGTVENTAGPDEGYSVYFGRDPYMGGEVISETLYGYYSHTGGTVGRVYPPPPPHKHAVSVDCETEGENLVTFLPLTSQDGALYIDGRAAEADSYYVLPAGHYYLAEDVRLDKNIYTTASTSNSVLDLCLNGYKLEYAGGGEKNVIFVGKGDQAFNLCDCNPTGEDHTANVIRDPISGYTRDIRGGVITGGTRAAIHQPGSAPVTLYGGTIAGNDSSASTSRYGGGVYANYVVMHGGTILYNKAYQGGGVFAIKSFTMTGGEISHNWAGTEGGVWLGDSATATLSGNAVISDNEAGTAKALSNLCLGTGRTVTVAPEGLGQNARVGVTTAAAPTAASPVTVATPGAGYTLTAGDLAKFSSDNSDYEMMLSGGSIILARPGAHTHAVSVDCKTDSGTQVIFKALTVNDSGVLCVDGTALTPNGPYTLPAGSYYLPDNITLNAVITIRDAASAPVNLCLNGHTLDLGDGFIDIDATNNRGNGVLNLCDCGQGGKVTSAHSGGYTNAATIEVSGQFALYGGTVENTSTATRNNHTVGLNGGAANLYGGKLVSRSDSALWVNGWQTDGLTLSGDVGFQGGADKADIYFYPSSIWEDNTHFTLAGPLTQPAVPWRVVAENGSPMPLVTGWSGHMGEADFDDYFRSATKGLFVGQRENGDLELAQCAITQQPSAANSCTVAANGAPVSVPAYQWYPATVTTADITTENAAAYYDNGEKETAAYDPATKLWSGVGWFEYGYFTIHLSKGAQITVKPDAQLAEHTELGLRPEPYNYNHRVRLNGDEANAVGEYVLTAPAEGDYIFYCESDHRRSADGIPAFSAKVTHVELGEALTGQAAPKLNADTAGDYLCRVTWADGTVLNSDIVTYAPSDSGKTEGKVEMSGEDTPTVSVDKETLKELAGKVQAGDTVTIKLTVEKLTEPEEKAEIDQLVTGKKDDVLYLELSLLKQVNDGEPKPITDTEGKVLEIAVDYDFAGKKDVTVYRKHGDAPAAALTKLTARPAGGFVEGSFFADTTNGKVYIYAGKFSTYAIGYTAGATTPSRPSGGYFAAAGHTLTVTAGENGRIDPHGAIWVSRNSNKTFAITPDEGYVVADVLVDGKSVGTVTQYTFENITADHTIAASFKQGDARPAWNPFADVKAGDWFYDSVKYVYENKLMLGTSKTTFEPDGTLTRAMLAVVLYRSAGSPQVEGVPEFEDTLADAWYSDAILWAAETKVLRGYSNGKFGPGDPVSEEMMNMVMGRLQGWDPAWVGDPDLALPATRAEIAQLLMEQSKTVR